MNKNSKHKHRGLEKKVNINSIIIILLAITLLLSHGLVNKVESRLVNHYNNVRALKMAKHYAKEAPLSKKALFEKLNSANGTGQFTVSESNYALARLKINYYENAVKRAKQYPNKGNEDDLSTIWYQLSADAGDKFTTNQAVYAVGQLREQGYKN
ncbi:Ltp family lipoprotein [Fructobacillus ficulneus]|uniref:Putative host cell surface-exposed lipoprotein Ltp-like HTH region domain-containing protein n=1 Tax=Fructobacillus ficulneus TaxID=157463 RepID=A0A0K8MFX5_9LACO|nr:Ltp family lipoprotein [Fructobacillus ficulneus]GAO99098.1 hypothetical protein FFIC_010030 [Fructobacillus ficulneus]